MQIPLLGPFMNFRRFIRLTWASPTARRKYFLCDPPALPVKQQKKERGQDELAAGSRVKQWLSGQVGLCVVLASLVRQKRWPVAAIKNWPSTINVYIILLVFFFFFFSKRRRRKTLGLFWLPSRPQAAAQWEIKEFHSHKCIKRI